MLCEAFYSLVREMRRALVDYDLMIYDDGYLHAFSFASMSFVVHRWKSCGSASTAIGCSSLNDCV